MILRLIKKNRRPGSGKKQMVITALYLLLQEGIRTPDKVLACPTSSYRQMERTAAWTAGDSPEECCSLGTGHGLPGGPQNPTGQGPEQGLKSALLRAGGQLDQKLLEVPYNPNLSVVL